MISVLISIKPKWCELIALGRKTIEIRKTKPNIDVPFKCYIYCTGSNECGKSRGYISPEHFAWRGSVIGEFICDAIDNIEIRHFTVFGHENRYCAIGETADKQWIKHSCLSYDEVVHYGKLATLYGWHISDLVIYDKPKELSEFFHACDKPVGVDCSKCIDERKNRCKSLARPPQSWCYVEEV